LLLLKPEDPTTDLRAGFDNALPRNERVRASPPLEAPELVLDDGVGERRLGPLGLVTLESAVRLPKGVPGTEGFLPPVVDIVRS
jgi:hypothetical protein